MAVPSSRLMQQLDEDRQRFRTVGTFVDGRAAIVARCFHDECV
jgi:hypothetical protein